MVQALPHMAGAGLDVLLLDIVPPTSRPVRAAANDEEPQPLRALGARQAAQSKAGGAVSSRDLERIRVGNLTDDLAAAGSCDLIIEAVREDIEVKRALPLGWSLLGQDTIVASNTSGLPIAKLMAGRGEGHAQRFLVTHFFNPVRYMSAAGSSLAKRPIPACWTTAHFGETALGKGIVFGHDTVNFVANRIGVLGMMGLIDIAVREGFTVEEIDAIFGLPLGRPKSAVFRTADLVGSTPSSTSLRTVTTTSPPTRCAPPSRCRSSCARDGQARHARR